MYVFIYIYIYIHILIICTFAYKCKHKPYTLPAVEMVPRKQQKASEAAKKTKANAQTSASCCVTKAANRSRNCCTFGGLGAVGFRVSGSELLGLVRR